MNLMKMKTKIMKMKNKVIVFISYMIVSLIIILCCALAWWFACQDFGIPFKLNQFSGIIWIALIFRWIIQINYK